MVNKKGFLRILEAIIAVLIILSTLLFVVVRNNADTTTANDICLQASSIMEEIGKNNTLRESVLNSDEDSIKNFLKNRIDNPLIGYRVRICNMDDLCSLNQGGFDKVEICASERLITTSLSRNEFQPKKLKIFLFKLN
jgi:hypothetical protein